MSKAKELLELRRQVEYHEGAVFFVKEDEDLIEKELANERQQIENKKKKNKSYFRPLDAYDFDEFELMDSIVPACCSQGCQVEPDGYCEHGHPSVLLFNGLI